jgi:hypothetical protein
VHTYPLVFQHQYHFSKEWFEVSPIDGNYDSLLPWWWLLKHVPTNFFSKRNICFSSEVCIQNYTEHAISSLLIKYDNNIATEVEQSGNPVARCLSYVQFDHKEKPKVHWAVVLLVAKAEAEVPGNMGLHKQDPPVYHKFLSIFEEKKVDTLLPYRSYNYAINVKEGKELHWGPIYALSEVELKALREYLDKILSIGKIQPSKSPAGAPILFVPKPYRRGIQLCIEYRDLNRILVSNWYPGPLMNELRDQVQEQKY